MCRHRNGALFVRISTGERMKPPTTRSPNPNMVFRVVPVLLCSDRRMSKISEEVWNTPIRLLVIVPCGQSKIWKKDPEHGPEKARNAYTGAPFKVNKAFAEKFSDKWMVLSAKYGFIEPNFVIPRNYNATFKKPSTTPITVETLKKQADEKSLHNYDIVIALGGEDYSSRVKQVFAHGPRVIAPATGLPLGIGMAHIKSLLLLSKEQMLRRIMNPDE